VNISAKTEYACLAMLELAAHYGSGEPVRIRCIAELLGIPSRFLVQILLQLKGAGLVASTRGAAGGYRLIQDPAGITLWDVMHLTEGKRTEVTRNAVSESSSSRVLMSVWNEVAQTEHSMLTGITLADLLERTQGDAQHMYFI